MDSLKEESNIAENAMGAVSRMSKFTIHLILLRVFEYGLLWSGPEIALYNNDESLHHRPPLYENIEKGLSVLTSIVKMIDERRQGDPFYPEFKTYWPQENFESK